MTLPFFASKFTITIDAPVRANDNGFFVQINVEYSRLDNTHVTRMFKGYGATDYLARDVALDAAVTWMKELG